MTIGYENLVKELPEFESKICKLKARDQQFSKLLNDYNLLENRIAILKDRACTDDGALLTDLKKRSLTIKDRMYIMLKNA
ncbi:YdcH family protein [Pseudoalteromonas luteoviolacea]|uniref:DUF465 domain-containing protein n=1 Tax=Pseudoalteromonas luteoviolacea DSM 6061 TaxID=1365250 RepID=A0A166UKX8_9GAMM|nr:DUF465 domain-containing protein [Pseudoalteromonas luteoviolacea]KZN30794.1 hypothetical protein N475_23980 [Pseudoalteromonas luteoviolacea DSM 6061]KZN53625.1 hypothetical protein N474_20040 [Pseudoalteromonas luteoviolacea CPMOR-2]MBE0386573.1 hypothetical protein [Pseudoalteromonas luteoviolacea DSM 6061]TQF71429.1 DUF465 domain-containing protein [Pseudoalteromonas luteoviolacea]